MPTPGARLRAMLAAGPVRAPLALDPMMARLAVAAGFPALYFGGGALGYQKGFTEANLTLTEMCAAALDIRAVTDAPLILDGAAGWGDPMHLRRTIALAEAAGFAAIEIEDQILPKRAHHHIGIEHLIPAALMVEKIREAVAARRDSDFLIIARTNAARQKEGFADALARAAAFRDAGADMLFVLPGAGPNEAEEIGRRLGDPAQGGLMHMAGGNRPGVPDIAALAALGYRLFVDAQTPLMAMHHALADCYARLRDGRPDPALAGEQARVHTTIDLDTLLAVERRTVER